MHVNARQSSTSSDDGAEQVSLAHPGEIKRRSSPASGNRWVVHTHARQGGTGAVGHGASQQTDFSHWLGCRSSANDVECARRGGGREPETEKGTARRRHGCNGRSRDTATSRAPTGSMALQLPHAHPEGTGTHPKVDSMRCAMSCSKAAWSSSLRACTPHHCHGPSAAW